MARLRRSPLPLTETLWAPGTTFADALGEAAALTDAVLDKLIALPDGLEKRVFEAMRYAALAPGKRLRPFLVLASAKLFAVAQTRSLQVAAAIELVHAYSLVHDDLPAMDNSDLRRGRPTCHKAFDDATAILAGDGLLTLAFEVLAHPDAHGDPAVRAELALALAQAAGGHGMVGGQMIDLIAEHRRDLDIGAITRLQRLKTGALIAFACEAGAILGKAPAEIRLALRGYAHDLGLAFQIADDLLDVEGDATAVGKATGKDAAAGKATLVALLGVTGARERLKDLVAEADRALAPFGADASMLKAAARFIAERKA
jgi:farnesyl diphosphate synthase